MASGDGVSSCSTTSSDNASARVRFDLIWRVMALLAGAGAAAAARATFGPGGRKRSAAILSSLSASALAKGHCVLSIFRRMIIK